jgi:hypothetical protein
MPIKIHDKGEKLVCPVCSKNVTIFKIALLTDDPEIKELRINNTHKHCFRNIESKRQHLEEYISLAQDTLNELYDEYDRIIYLKNDLNI